MLSGVLDKWGYVLIPQILSVLLLMSGIFGFGFFLLSFVTRSLESTFYCFLRSVPSPVSSSSAPCLAILFPCGFEKRTFALYRRVTANFCCIFSDKNRNKSLQKQELLQGSIVSYLQYLFVCCCYRRFSLNKYFGLLFLYCSPNI